MNEKIQRNSACPCGSGKKYKQCCLIKQAPAATHTVTGKKKFKATVMNPTKDPLLFSSLKSEVADTETFEKTTHDYRVMPKK